MSLYPSAKGSSTVDDVVHRLQSLAIPSRPQSPSQSSPSISLHPSSPSVFESPFTYSWSAYRKESQDDLPTIIDTFAPRRPSFDLSPTSSASSDLDSSMPYCSGRSPFDAFFATQSRVVRLSNLPPPACSFLSAVFFQNRSAPIPATMWALRNGPGPNDRDSVWAVFKSHEEARRALSSLSGSTMLVDPALESDLEPFSKLRRFELMSSFASASPTVSLPPPSPSNPHHHFLRMSSSASDLQGYARGMARAGPESLPRSDYVISSNPPNPRTSFRLGDWICGSPNCAAHNFGRNLACIGCGCPRPDNRTPSPHHQSPSACMQPNRLPSSPRFVSPPNTVNSSPFAQSPVAPMHSPTYPNLNQMSSFPQTHSPSVSHPLSAAKSPPPVHHLLTPSGRAFAVGGKVQNISTDPLSPCVMYWPDNEPFPEQGQIRPSSIMGVPQPPILNTGNRGPIEHQPGDWICLKCNYLNWRRRKVCQTCFPYAEGNGDSISAAVQAERIALLTSVLAQGQGMSSPATPHNVLPPSHTHRSHSLTPPQRQQQYVDTSPPQLQLPVHRSQSQFELGVQRYSQPIYQTSGPRQSSLPFPGSAHPARDQDTFTPAPLLPSFLQDIVQAPTHSPESTSPSSAEFSVEYDEHVPMGTTSRAATGSSNLAISNIWKLGGDETKGLSGIALPNRHDLLGGSRKDSREMLRRPSQPSLP
ncbi:hypothetical protein PILCRDRAFT_825351 [Piloderma croceum F 1598]|uniref:RanBP2-type domain-containing protein n=1 Tax=Piloderma croceum (strain F 1598) TaxID=765440 RepID=A0A0C3FC99_PILCF|nr:hypothetical protein PILCRDRAFT_825351 [Piloderma croceum F 1598]